ncbi:MAG: helix-turn-helix transcriptional regulator [Eubacterium sp.]|nr:helix-turn-helix transcriptional regulator [Eubacterium sp.]
MNNIEFITDKEFIIFLGERIKSIRMSRNISQEEFAEKAGISVSYLSQIENGHKNPRATILCKICTGNDIQPNQLFSDSEEKINLLEIIKNNSSDLTLHDTNVIMDYFVGLQNLLKASHKS